MAAAATPPGLPLHCSICPKKPNFSDVSHLLTHIASKSHLSHYYKIKVRSSHDLDAKITIDSYDQWYANHNVEHLMSERMHLKDQKRSRLRGHAYINDAKRGLTVAAPLPNIRKESQATAPTLDPFLSNSFSGDGFVLDDIPAMTSYPPYPPWLNFAPIPASKTYKPQMALWRTVRPKSLVPMAMVIPSSPPEFSLRMNPRPGPGRAPEAKMWSNSPRAAAPAPFEAEDDGGNEATKLKGVYWPGMDIFDAATPETKRKRNQKKDTSVAIQLERHSLFVEPTEMIFTPLGSLKKSRVISGQVDFDSSPERHIAPTPKPKRRTSSRLPLAKKDGNASSAVARAPQQSQFPGYGPVNNTALTGSAPSKKPKRQFEVFDDEQHRQQSENATHMRFLTSGFRPATHSGPEGRPPVPQTLVDINTGALYHNNFFAEAFETVQPTFYGVPYYGHGYYGHTGFAFPNIFSSPPQPQRPLTQQAVPATTPFKVEDAQDAVTVSANSED